MKIAAIVLFSTLLASCASAPVAQPDTRFFNDAQFKAPSVAVIGEVVKLRGKLNWFENRPLFGQRIVVTRTREQASELSRRLLELGAEVLEIPTIKIAPPTNKEDLKDFRLCRVRLFVQTSERTKEQKKLCGDWGCQDSRTSPSSCGRPRRTRRCATRRGAS
jgi:hypothetical protein